MKHITKQKVEAWKFLKESNKWVTTQQVADEAQVERRTAEAYLKEFINYGFCSREKVSPGYLYKFIDRGDGAREFLEKLEKASAIFNSLEAAEGERKKVWEEEDYVSVLFTITKLELNLKSLTLTVGC